MAEQAVQHVTFRNQDMFWDIAADIYYPADFDESKQYPAIVVAHPIGSCKDQTSGNIYSTAFAAAGFIAIAFDASFQGESGGTPRRLEDPAQRVKTSAASKTSSASSTCPTSISSAWVCSASAAAATRGLRPRPRSASRPLSRPPA